MTGRKPERPGQGDGRRHKAGHDEAQQIVSQQFVTQCLAGLGIGCLE
jgi:hypothetical protein